MSDVINIRKNETSLKASPESDPFSAVVLKSGDNEYTAGNKNNGRTLEIDCPWGSQEIANNLLDSVQGQRYRPFSASGSQVDMAAEIGDAISMGSVYSGLYSQDITFGKLSVSEISAPGDEEVDHEFDYKSKDDKDKKRQYDELKNAISDEALARAGGIGGLQDRILQITDGEDKSLKDIVEEIDVARSEIIQTKNQILQTVSDLSANLNTKIDQKTNSISLTVNQKIGEVEETLSGIFLDGDKVTIKGKTVDLTGFITASTLSGTIAKLQYIDTQTVTFRHLVGEDGSSFLGFNTLTWKNCIRRISDGKEYNGKISFDCYGVDGATVTQSFSFNIADTTTYKNGVASARSAGASDAWNKCVSDVEINRESATGGHVINLDYGEVERMRLLGHKTKAQYDSGNEKAVLNSYNYRIVAPSADKAFNKCRDSIELTTSGGTTISPGGSTTVYARCYNTYTASSKINYKSIKISASNYSHYGKYALYNSMGEFAGYHDWYFK